MSWDHYPHKNVRARLKPYIGSGLTLRAVAAEIGCSHVAVYAALKRMGASLKPDQQKAA